MSVTRREAVSVMDRHDVSVAAQPTRKSDPARAGGIDRISASPMAPQINSRMKPSLPRAVSRQNFHISQWDSEKFRGANCFWRGRALILARQTTCSDGEKENRKNDVRGMFQAINSTRLGSDFKGEFF